MYYIKVSYCRTGYLDWACFLIYSLQGVRNIDIATIQYTYLVHVFVLNRVRNVKGVDSLFPANPSELIKTEVYISEKAMSTLTILLASLTLYNVLLRIARNLLETRENIKIECHLICHIICD